MTCCGGCRYYYSKVLRTASASWSLGVASQPGGGNRRRDAAGCEAMDAMGWCV